MKRIVFVMMFLSLAIPMFAGPVFTADNMNWKLDNTLQWGYRVSIVNSTKTPYIRFMTKDKRTVAIYDYRKGAWVEYAKSFNPKAIDLNRFYAKGAPKTDGSGKIKMNVHNTIQYGYLIKIVPENNRIRFLAPKSKSLMAIYDYEKMDWVIQDKDFKTKSVDIAAFFEDAPKPGPQGGQINMTLHNTIQFGYYITINQKDQVIRFLTPKSKRLMAIYEYDKMGWGIRDKRFKTDRVDINVFFGKREIRWDLNNTIQFGYLIRILKKEGQIRFVTPKSKRTMAIYNFKDEKWAAADPKFKKERIDLEAFYTQGPKKHDPKPPVTHSKKKHLNKKLHRTVQQGYYVEVMDDGMDHFIVFYTTKSRQKMAVYNHTTGTWTKVQKAFNVKVIKLDPFFDDDMHNEPTHHPKKPFKPKLN